MNLNQLKNKVWKINSYPKSLDLLVRFFRIFGIGNGTVDLRCPNNQENGRLSFRWPQIKWLLWSIACIGLLCFNLEKFFILTSDTIYQIVGEQNNSQWLLRFLMGSIIYLFEFDNFISWIYFSLIGGHKLVYHLSDMTLLNNDTNVRLAKHILAFFLFVIALLNIVTNVFNALYNTPSSASFFDINLILRRMFIQFSFLSTQYQICIYAYMMVVYRRQIKQIKEQYSCLTPKQMNHLKRQIYDLQLHYHRANCLLQFPVIISVFTCTWAVIACFCMMVTNDSYRLRYTGFTIYIIMQALIRVVVLIHMGQFVHWEYCEFLWFVRHRTLHWTPLQWLYFLQLESLKKRFVFSLFNILTIDQTLVTSLVAFVLNYLVIIIQTGNNASHSVNATKTP